VKIDIKECIFSYKTD